MLIAITLRVNGIQKLNFIFSCFIIKIILVLK